MTTTMDVSEVMLYLDLMKKGRRTPGINELKMMLYFLDNYEQVKEFHNKLIEHEFRPPFVFYNGSFIHFIEEYDDCVNLKSEILQTQRIRRRNYSILFIHQILLSKSEEQAICIIKEAKDYGIELGEVWTSRYDSMWRIKNDQKAWRENIIQLGESNHFTEIYEEFCNLKSQYFDSLSLIQLKQALQENETHKNAQIVTQTTVYNRCIFVKEYARRVAQGICQLCDKEAPFIDKRGQPFLEVHHIHYLSKGGSDTIDNVVALCPNCHRRIHQLELEEDAKKLQKKHY